jgi:hypothetical protein
LSFWLQLVLREMWFRTKSRALVTFIYFEPYEGVNQFSKLPCLIHNHGHKTATAVLTVHSCTDSDRVSYLLRIQGTDLRFPNTRGFVSPAYSRLYIISCLSRWPRGLRRKYVYVFARLSGFRVRISPWAYTCLVNVSYQAEVSATSRSFVESSPTEYGVSECDLETSTIR